MKLILKLTIVIGLYFLVSIARADSFISVSGSVAFIAGDITSGSTAKTSHSQKFNVKCPVAPGGVSTALKASLDDNTSRPESELSFTLLRDNTVLMRKANEGAKILNAGSGEYVFTIQDSGVPSSSYTQGTSNYSAFLQCVEVNTFSTVPGITVTQ